MATKVKPSRLQVSGQPQAGKVPVYVDEDTFQWGDGGGDIKVFEIQGPLDYATAEASRAEYLNGTPVLVMYGGNAYQYTTDSVLYSDIPTVFSTTTISTHMLTYTMSGDNVTGITSDIVTFTKPGVIDNLTSSSTTDALSANQGKELKTLIDNLTSRGRFLSLWNGVTGLAVSTPQQLPYTYQTGDYFIVGVASQTTNYRPDGSSYTGTASTVVETEEVEVGDTYAFDGTNWLFQSNHGKTVTFANLVGDPYDNVNLANALNDKYDASNPAGYTTCTGTLVASDLATYAKCCDIPTNNNQLANGCGYTTCTGTVVASDLTPYAKTCDLPNFSCYQLKSCMVCNLSGADNTHYPTAKAVADAMACAGTGDMLKSVYDPDNIGANAFDYDNFINTPTIPTNNNQLANGCGYTTCTGTLVAADIANLAQCCDIPTNNNQLTNGCGYTTCTGTISTCSQIISTLGYTPYNSTNPNGYTTCTGTVSTCADVISALGYTPYSVGNPCNYINSFAGVIGALGYTPYNTTNPCGYTSCTGTLTASNISDAAYGSTWNGVTTVAPSKNAVYDKIENVVSSIPTNNNQLTNGCGYTTCTGTISTCSQIISTLGYTPYNSTNPNGYTTCTGTLTSANISDTAYASSWNGVTTVAPSKNAVYDKIESVVSSIPTNNRQLANGCGYTTCTGTVVASDLAPYVKESCVACVNGCCLTNGGNICIEGGGGGVSCFVDVLVVGGGGAGGISRGGGGGGGEVTMLSKHSISGDMIPVIVGEGACGALDAYIVSERGKQSYAGDVIANGGGGGGTGGRRAGSGGSGGGGGCTLSAGCDFGRGCTSILNPGGHGHSGGWGNTCCAGGGGGGAGEAGLNAPYARGFCPAMTTTSCGGKGGDGIGTDFTGTTMCFGGGGGGASGGGTCGGCGGLGGGGGGGNCTVCATKGEINTGGGGGGSYGYTAVNGINPCAACLDGGGGFVAIKYPTDGRYGFTNATGGTKTVCGDYTIHTFTSNDIFLPNGAGNKCYVQYFIVGGGGAGCTHGGGGGGVNEGGMEITGPTCIIVGAGGQGTTLGTRDGGDSCVGIVVAKGGCWGGCLCGTSGSGMCGGTTSGTQAACGKGGGGGASWIGYDASGTQGGKGGRGCRGYAGGGGGGGCNASRQLGVDGGGNGGTTCGCNATNCGGGGGGARCSSYPGGCGAGGIVMICYPTDGRYGFTCATGGNSCTMCDGYCVHTFTSDGTFTIVS